MLSALGLSPDEERLYRALVTSTEPTPLPDLARQAELPDPVVGPLLAGLTERGLVTQLDQGFTVAPPAIALGALLRQQRDDLRSVELELVALTEAHRKATLGRNESDVIEVITGQDAVRHRFAQIQHAARDQIRSIVVPHSRVVPPGENEAEPASMARGVRYRVIADRQWLQMPGARDIVADALSEGEQLRIVDRVPIKMIIADRELGMLPLSSDHHTEPASVLVHRSGILEAMIALFDELWHRGRPLNDSDGDRSTLPLDAQSRLDDLDKQTLRLLLAGLTDHAIAGHLEMSPRTVQRRIRQLMDLAGVTTRIQLGWQAARQDWL